MSDSVLTALQEYQQDIFAELRNEDQLCILARGLGLLHLTSGLLHAYDTGDGKSLVILVGAEDQENYWIGEALAESAAISRAPRARGLRMINTDTTNVAKREEIYSEGGIVSVTSRILVVDLLSKLLDPETVTGLVILHAEKIVATSVEAFIVRIYRQFNKLGFLKALSDSPEPFVSRFAPLATTLGNLFLRKSSLWPRYHLTVARALEGRKAEVIELEVAMSEAMSQIQAAILECVEVSITELKKANTGLEMEDWTLDSALHKNFDVIVRRQLDPVWHRISFRTRQIASDLTVLRNVLHCLLSYDCVSLNKYLDTIHAAHQPPPGSTRQNQSPWLFMDAADTIFQVSKGRVYRGKVVDQTSATALSTTVASLSPILEEQPKWAVLSEVLAEIERDKYFNPTVQDDSSGTILIMCGDQRTCGQLREYIQTMHVKAERDEEATGETDEEPEKPSANFMLRRKLREYIDWKRDFGRVSAALFSENEKSIHSSSDGRYSNSYRGRAPPNKRRRVRGGGNIASGPIRGANGSVVLGEDKASQVAGLLAELQPSGAEEIQKQEVIDDDLEDMEGYFELYEMKDLVIVHPYEGDLDDHILEEVKPRHIIMYEPDAAFIRRIEVYRSSHTNRNVRVYFMYYGGSVEEQRYLSAVRREKDAFTRLIKEKGSMALTLTLDGQAVEDPQDHFLRTVNTRIAGGGRLAATAAPPTVVVDVREFRSALPSLLHGRSMVVVPCQLTVGDYVLSPNVCIERKSVRDLIASFKNGRLFNQVETMLLYYENPMLLIEFDQHKSFTLDPFADLTSAAALKSADNSNDLQSRLVLLTIAFPRLKVIWSSSPYQTAEIFEELKKNADEPDPLRAVQLGLGFNEDPNDRTFNQTPQDMLRLVPGITNKNISRLILEVGSLREVANMTDHELDELVGREAGRQVHRFFNRSVFDDEQE